MIRGTVYKAVGGYFFVRSDRGEYRCYLRGRLRRQKLLVGDRVSLEVQNNHTGVIEKVEPRQTQLIRPPIANVELALIVFSFTQPDPNLFLLDRFLLQSEIAGIKPVIVFNKSDLVDSDHISAGYKDTGYRVIITSAKTGRGINELNDVLRGRISVFAGPSGVGKSSLLNCLQPGLSLQTGEISPKLKRGRHTTRHVELLELDNGGLVADTPGFSSLHLPPDLTSAVLPRYFPDMEVYAPGCRFSGCLHYKEPGCAVKRAWQEGKIASFRYENYLSFLKEVIQQERRY